MTRPRSVPPRRARLGCWTRVAVSAGSGAAWLSSRLGLGAGSIIGGRVTLALHPRALSRLAAGRAVVLVSGTNGKTTTSHLLAAALRTAGAVAHNASGSNMPDGAVAALAADVHAGCAVLEVDELHLAAVADAVHPAVVVLLNLSRDQLDRGSEVRAIAAALGAALAAHPDTVVVANADDPMVVSAVGDAADVVWVSAGATWSSDAATCPRCGSPLRHNTPATPDTALAGGTGAVPGWSCACGLTRPAPRWAAADGVALTPLGAVAVPLALPGRFNLGNAVVAIAAATVLGIGPRQAAAAMGRLDSVAGRYARIRHGHHDLRLLLAKNPAGWAETLTLLDPAGSLLVAVNAREADGRDTSWLWDVEFEQLNDRTEEHRTRPRVIAAGERAADVGVRLGYAEIAHHTVADPIAALSLLPPGPVDVVANYTAFHQLLARLPTPARPAVPGPVMSVPSPRRAVEP